MSPTLAPAPPRIDPRIRARRLEVQRDRGRRRLRRLVALAGLTATLAAGWGLARSPLLDVDHVRVTGTSHTSPDAVVAATGIERGAPLLTADLGAAASSVAELPWVQTVDVARAWPGTVRVTVVERVAVAAVPAVDGGWLLLDSERRQLDVVPEAPPETVRLEVPPVEPEPGATLEGVGAALEVAASAPAVLRDRLVTLRDASDDTGDDTGDAAVVGTVRLRDGAEATVRFGGTDRLEAKWLALVSVLEEVDPAGLTGIDVRVPSAPALTRG